MALDATELTSIIPEVWSKEVHRARYSIQVGTQVAHMELSDEMSGKGDIINLHYFPRVTIKDVTAATGAISPQDVTIANVQLTVDHWKEASVTIVDRAAMQSLFTSEELQSKFAAEFSPALAEKMDNDLFALYSNLTYSVGEVGDPGNMSDDLVKAALQKFDELRIPKSDRNFVLSPKAFWDLFGQDKFVLAHMTGRGTGQQIEGLESIPRLYGCRWFMTPEVSSGGAPSVSRNLLLHKQALAQAVQKTIGVEKLARTALATTIVGNVLYGEKVMRPDHGIVIYTKYA